MGKLMFVLFAVSLSICLAIPVSAQDGTDVDAHSATKNNIYLPLVSNTNQVPLSAPEESAQVVAGSELPTVHLFVPEGVKPDQTVFYATPGNMRNLLNGQQDNNAVQAASIYNGDWGNVYTQRPITFGPGGGTTAEYMKGRNGWYRFAPFKTGAYLDGYAKASSWGVGGIQSIRLHDTITVNGLAVSISLPGGSNGGLTLIQSNVLDYDSGAVTNVLNWTLSYTNIRYEGIGTTNVQQTASGTYRWNKADYLSQTFGSLPQ